MGIIDKIKQVVGGMAQKKKEHRDPPNTIYYRELPPMPPPKTRTQMLDEQIEQHNQKTAEMISGDHTPHIADTTPKVSFTDRVKQAREKLSPVKEYATKTAKALPGELERSKNIIQGDAGWAKRNVIGAFSGDRSTTKGKRGRLVRRPHDYGYSTVKPQTRKTTITHQNTMISSGMNTRPSGFDVNTMFSNQSPMISRTPKKASNQSFGGNFDVNSMFSSQGNILGSRQQQKGFKRSSGYDFNSGYDVNAGFAGINGRAGKKKNNYEIRL